MAIRNKILIIGAGRLGSIIADRASSRGENVIVLDENDSSFRKLDEAIRGNLKKKKGFGIRKPSKKQ